MPDISEVTILTVLFLGFLLGLKHAMDADHIVAVTTIVSRSKSLLRSTLVGLSWGIGHTLTIFVVGFGVLVLKLAISDRLALFMEFAVGVMLVILGIPLIWRLVTGRVHVHLHQHGDKRHIHSHSHQETPTHDHRHIRKSLVVGMVHGMAGSAALTLLILSSMSSVVQGLFFLLFFGIGTILGMLLFSGLITIPFKLTARLSFRLNLWFQGAAGIISLFLGIVIMWQTGFAGGLLLAAT